MRPWNNAEVLAFGSRVYSIIQQENNCVVRHLLLIILVLLLIGAIPSWPYSTEWGYYPSSGIGIILIIVLILVLMGRL